MRLKKNANRTADLGTAQNQSVFLENLQVRPSLMDLSFICVQTLGMGGRP